MGQFSVYKNNNPKSKKTFPYLLDIQSELLAQIRTTVVIPLGKYSAVKSHVMTKLTPVVEIDGVKYAGLTQQLAGVDRKLLGSEVTTLINYRAEFIDAIDFMISGI